MHSCLYCSKFQEEILACLKSLSSTSSNNPINCEYIHTYNCCNVNHHQICGRAFDRKKTSPQNEGGFHIGVRFRHNVSTKHKLLIRPQKAPLRLTFHYHYVTKENTKSNLTKLLYHSRDMWRWEEIAKG